MKFYPFHVGDYAASTRHLSWDEDAAYRRLLDLYYSTERPLPTDQHVVCRLSLAQTDAQRAAIRAVLDEFFELTQDGWINRRADETLAAMREKQQRQRDKANKRWTDYKVNGNATAMPRHTKDHAAASISYAAAMPPIPIPKREPSPDSSHPNIDTGESNKHTRKKFEKNAPGEKPRSTLCAADLVADGVQRQHADDWLRVRAQKRAPLTATAWAACKREAEKAGVSIGEAVRISAERSWQGFKAAWLSEIASPTNRRSSIHDERAATIAALTGRNSRDNHAVIDITHDPLD